MDSAIQAKHLLDAWNQGDMSRWHTELDRTAALCSVADEVEPAESERRELLDVVAQRMRRRNLESHEIRVCLGFLRHLGAPFVSGRE